MIKMQEIFIFIFNRQVIFLLKKIWRVKNGKNKYEEYSVIFNFLF